jgi:hypothetical protein
MTPRLRLFEDEASRPARARPPVERTAAADDDLLHHGPALLCGRCRRPITSEAARIDVGGHHVHTRVNPHDVTFTFGCFARAEGCRAASPPSSEWSWFPGYRWQIASCADCGLHLGWAFQAADHQFHGLILDRLVEGDRPSTQG